MIPGVCKLCQEKKMLCRSHLVPARLYKYCRAGELAPIRFTAKEIGHSDEELAAYLLCSKCENLLNRDGETWLVPKLATAEQSFPFYDLLVQGQPDVVEPDFIAYACSRNKHIGFRKLTNFAVGVFWKASVHPWRGGRTTPQIELGDYREQFRQFLTHKSKFPDHACLSVLIASPGKAVIGFNLPELRRKQPYHQYLFHIPGMVFILAVGKRINAAQKEMCFYSSPLHPIIVGDLSRGILMTLARASRNAIRTSQAAPFLPPRQQK